MSKPADVWYADAATGQMNRRKMETNPRLEGDEVVWTGEGWVPASEFVTRAAAGMLPARSAKVQPEPQLPAWLNPKRTPSPSEPAASDAEVARARARLGLKAKTPS